MNKRGVSSVVATVLLILLTVVAVGVIAQFLVPYVRNTLDDSSACIDYQDYVSFNKQLNFNCYGDSKYSFSIQVANKPELYSNLEGFVIGLEGDNVSKPLRIVSGSNEISMLDSNEVAIPKSGETRTYSYVSDYIYNHAKIYSLIKNSRGSERLCEMPDDEIEIKRCA